MKDEAERIAAGLSEESRVLWIKTVLVVADTEPRRRAFIAGYNGYARPSPCSDGMRRSYQLGVVVQRALENQEPSK